MPEREEILTELTTISPTLAEIPFKPVFAVPAGYFDEFASIMIEKIKKEGKSGVKEELESISPFLASLERKNPFSVPEGYFAALAKDLESISDTPQVTVLPKPAKLIQFRQASRLRILYAAAAIVALLGFFTWFFGINEGESTVTEGTVAVNLNAELPKVSATEMANYLEESLPEDLNLEPISLAGVEEADLDEIMDGINEAELQQFINENPGLQESNMN